MDQAAWVEGWSHRTAAAGQGGQNETRRTKSPAAGGAAKGQPRDRNRTSRPKILKNEVNRCPDSADGLRFTVQSSPDPADGLRFTVQSSPDPADDLRFTVQSSPDPADDLRLTVQSSPDPADDLRLTVQSSPDPADDLRLTVQSSPDPAVGLRMTVQSSPDPAVGLRMTIQSSPDPPVGLRLIVQSSADPAVGLRLTGSRSRVWGRSLRAGGAFACPWSWRMQQGHLRSHCPGLAGQISAFLSKSVRAVTPFFSAFPTTHHSPAPFPHQNKLLLHTIGPGLWGNDEAWHPLPGAPLRFRLRFVATPRLRLGAGSGLPSVVLFAFLFRVGF